MRKLSLLLVLMLFSAAQLLAQRTITGTVTGDDGKPLPAVTVLVNGDVKQAAQTDVSGKYSIKTPANGKFLRFSFVGMKTQDVNIKNSNVLDVTLTGEASQIEGVVITALGVSREKKALGYAVTDVKGVELQTANAISPIASLQGKAAGVQIAQSDGGMFGATKIQIRGAATLRGNNQPIYVVDGIILDNTTSGNETLDWGGNESAGDYGNELKNLNPDDFESISILKGAAATALYGSRGLNGAVVITTKSGKGFKGLGVSLSQSFGIDALVDFPGIQYEYSYGLWPGNRQNYGKDENPWKADGFKMNSNGLPTLKGAPYLSYAWGPKLDGQKMENYDGTFTTYSPYKNGMKDFYQTGFNSNTNVSFKGGTDKSAFFASLSYKNATSTTPNNTFSRYAMLLKGNYKVNSRIDVEGSVSFAQSQSKNAAQEIGQFFVFSATIPNFVSPAQWKDKYTGKLGGIAHNDYGDPYGYVPTRVKEIWWNLNNKNELSKEYVIRPTFDFTYKIADWVKFKAEANANLYVQNFEKKHLGSGYAKEGGYYSLSAYIKEQFTTAGSFVFNKTLNDFVLGGFVRGEIYNKSEQYNFIETDGGLTVPGQFFINNSKNTPRYEARPKGRKQMYSAIFSFNSSWKDQLYIDVTGRNDWSSALAYTNGTGNFSYFYPSVSASWLLHNTLQLPSWVSFAKLRASWAQVGNDAEPYEINTGYKIETIKTASGNIYTNNFSSTTLRDLNLKPERKNALEAGVDFRVLNDRIGLDIAVYKENTTDQIMNISVPNVSGVESKMINAGNIQNTGIEIALNTVPVRTTDWEWKLNFTYTRNRSKIVELHKDVAEYIPLQGYVNAYDYRIGSVAKVGGAYGVLMSDALPARDEKGNTILVWDKDDRIGYAKRDGTVKETGDMNPKFLASLNTSLAWKNLTLRVALDARYGGYVASYANKYGLVTGYTKPSLQYRDEARGGITWTSKWLNKDGTKSGSYDITYHDGVIPEGIFDKGTQIDGADGKTYDVGGKTYAELVKQGVLEPVHAGAYHYYRNDWGTGIVNNTWVSELSYIALREVTLAYQVDKKIARKIGVSGLNIAVTGRNLGYLYNSLPNNLNPESVRGNRSGEFRIRSFNPYTANFLLTLNVDF